MRRVALLALLVVGVTPSAAQTPLPVEQGVIVFVREDFNAEEEPPPAFEVLDVATGTVREILRAEDITAPSISPDGRLVAYVSNRFSRGNELRVIGIDGKGDRRVLRVAADRHICECGPGWTPDGRRIVFSVVRKNPKGGLDESTNEIYSIGVGGHKLRRVTRNHREDGGPVVTRDGKRIVIYRRTAVAKDFDYDLWSIAIGGGDEHRITRGDPAQDLNASVAADSRSVAYARCICNLVDDDRRHLSSIRVINIDGSGVRTLAADVKGSDFDPDWSPSGAQVAFASDRADQDADRDGVTYNQLFAVNADGIGLRRLLTSPFDDGQPSWGPTVG